LLLRNDEVPHLHLSFCLITTPGNLPRLTALGEPLEEETLVTLKSPIQGYPAYKVPHPSPEALVRLTLENLHSSDWERN
ncbi:Protein FAM179Blike, partial [Caligus rogercresseyi]